MAGGGVGVGRSFGSLSGLFFFDLKSEEKACLKSRALRGKRIKKWTGKTGGSGGKQVVLSACKGNRKQIPGPRYLGGIL